MGRGGVVVEGKGPQFHTPAAPRKRHFAGDTITADSLIENLVLFFERGIAEFPKGIPA